MIRSLDRGLLLVLLVSTVIQGFVLWKARDKPCRGDECRYLYCARSVVAGDGWEYHPVRERRRGGDLPPWDAGHTPPLYVLFIGAHMILFEGESWPTQLTQLLLVLATGGLAYGDVKKLVETCISDSWSCSRFTP